VIRSPFPVLALIGALFFALVYKAELQPDTVSAFDRYIAVTEERIASDLRHDRYFVIDRLPDTERRRAYDGLRRGEVHIEQLHTTDDGRPLPMPGGMIHHWVGLAFIPGVTLNDALVLLQDANQYQQIYKPAVRHSRLITSREGFLQVSEQFYRKTIVTIAANADFDAHYHFLGPRRLVCQSYSTRIAEVEHPGEPSEQELPVGNDHGYLWRLYSYWHLEEKDGGVYLQLEFVTLSRTVPPMLVFVVQPFIKSVPHGILESLLITTRSAVIAHARNHPASTVTLQSSQ
jgi:hypothetical protein